MLNHFNVNPMRQERVVILGAKGFVGAASAGRLSKEKIDCLALGRDDVDLMCIDAADQLIKILRPRDALIIVSAKAPCKNYAMLLDNIQIIRLAVIRAPQFDDTLTIPFLNCFFKGLSLAIIIIQFTDGCLSPINNALGGKTRRP